MRFRDISGIRMPVSNEEDALVMKIEESDDSISRDDLNYREREVARKLVSRGVLHRFSKDETLFYELNSSKDTDRI